MHTGAPQQRPPVVLVAAVARDGVIGHEGGLPWHLPEDLAHFRKLTWGHPVLMGRKTWDSLPERFRPLPGRRNLVLTRQAGWQADGAQAVASVEEALTACAAAPMLCVIGGAQVYAAAWRFAERLCITEIDAEVAGDVRFPHWPPEGFVCTERAEQPPSSQGGLRFAFAAYERVAAA